MKGNREQENNLTFSSLPRENRIFLFVGPGGVGKTTLAASFSLLFKEKTLCITVDPSKRLKSALGIENLDEVFQINNNFFLQIDPSKSFSDFLDEYFPDLKWINDFELYKIASSLLPSDEYISAERIGYFYGKFEKIVVDTPPSQKLFAFLNAPQKILNLIESKSFSYFIDFLSGRNYLPLKISGKLLGFRFLEDFSKLLSSLKSMFGLMEEKARRVKEIIRNSDIVMITNPYKIPETLQMLEFLRSERLKPKYIIVNRFWSFSSPPINSPEDLNVFFEKLKRVSKSMMENIRRLMDWGDVFCMREVFYDLTSIENLRKLHKEKLIKIF